MTACTPEQPCGESDRCDACAADLLLLRRYVDPYASLRARCNRCAGTGIADDIRHPWWGTAYAEAPTIEGKCPDCGGSGAA